MLLIPAQCSAKASCTDFGVPAASDLPTTPHIGTALHPSKRNAPMPSGHNSPTPSWALLLRAMKFSFASIADARCWLWNLQLKVCKARMIHFFQGIFYSTPTPLSRVPSVYYQRCHRSTARFQLKQQVADGAGFRHVTVPNGTGFSSGTIAFSPLRHLTQS